MLTNFDIDVLINRRGDPGEEVGHVEIIDAVTQLAESERAAIPDWWERMIGSDPRGNASVVADAWATTLPNSFESLLSIRNGESVVHVARLIPTAGASKFGVRGGIGLLYVTGPAPGVSHPFTVTFGYPPNPKVAESGTLPPLLGAVYQHLHDGIDVDVSNAITRLLGASSIETWEEWSGQDDDSLNLVADPPLVPYVPGVENLKVLWTESASGMTYMVDSTRTAAIWSSGSGEVDFFAFDESGEALLAAIECAMLPYLGWNSNVDLVDERYRWTPPDDSETTGYS